MDGVTMCFQGSQCFARRFINANSSLSCSSSVPSKAIRSANRTGEMLLNGNMRLNFSTEGSSRAVSRSSFVIRNVFSPCEIRQNGHM